MRLIDEEGMVFEGTALEIVRKLRREDRFFKGPLEAWMTEVARRVWRFHGIGVNPGNGVTEEEQAERLLTGLIKAGLLKTAEGC